MKWLLLGLALILVSTAASARTWYVKPDSTGDAPTIGAAIDSAEANDRILVAAGTYTETSKWIPEGTAMLVLKSGVTLESESGRYSTVLDADGNRRVLICAHADTNTVLEGFTIQNGSPTSTPHNGGGLYCYDASPRVLDCDFVGNHADYGGGIDFSYCSSPEVRFCNFQDNEAAFNGGGINAAMSPVEIYGCSFTNNAASFYGGGVRLAYCDGEVLYCRFLYNHAGSAGGGLSAHGDQSTIDHCTFCVNQAPTGSGLVFAVERSSNVMHNIIAFGGTGAGVACQEGASDPVLACCDIYGNVGGDWTGCVQGQDGVDGNFSENPLFCDIVGGDLSVEDCSPCLEGNHPYEAPCGTLGADQPGCACGEATEATTWGAIKSLYR